MHVRDMVDRRNIVTVNAQDELATAVRLLFIHNIGGLPVIGDDGAIVGFLAERDIVRTLYGHMSPVRNMHVRDAMRSPKFCDAGDSIEYAMQMMTVERVRHLIVRDDGRMIGVISVGDMVKYRLGQLETETAVLRDYLAAHRATH